MRAVEATGRALLAMLLLFGVAFANPTVLLLHVHGPDGKQEIEVNVDQISSIRQPRHDSSYHFSEGVRCLLFMTSGSFIATAETCKEIVDKIAALDKHESR